MASSSSSGATAKQASNHSSSSHTKKSPMLPERSHSLSSMSLPKPPSSRRDPPPLPPSMLPEGDWETREEVKMKELEEARARAAQMEKTMRWWSDCTANWREKWSKVRNERNKSREECRHLRSKLETYAKEASNQKKEKEELKIALDKLKKTLSSYEEMSSSMTSNKAEKDKKHKSVTKVTGNESEDFLSELLLRQDKDQNSSSSKDSDKKSDSGQPKATVETVILQQDPMLEQKLLAVKMKLEEAQKTILMEREEKSNLLFQIDELKTEMSMLEAQQDEFKIARDDLQSKLETVQSQYQKEIGRVTEDLEDEFSSRSDLNIQLGNLRKELEKIQAENAQEWGKRERLESEKLALERDNKKLRIEIGNLEEDLQRKNQQANVLLDGDLKTLQFELSEKTKEVTDLKHSIAKMKKALSDKCGELDHTKSRTEQYEVEVKKLRVRVDELKQDLARGEDEVDQQANQIRRLQRTNDELQVQCENLQVQVEHLQTRLRSSTTTGILPGQRSTSHHKGFDIEDDATIDTPTSEDDNED